MSVKPPPRFNCQPPEVFNQKSSKLLPGFAVPEKITPAFKASLVVTPNVHVIFSGTTSNISSINTVFRPFSILMGPLWYSNLPG